MSCSETSTVSQAERAEHLDAARPRRRRSSARGRGAGPATSRRSSFGICGEPREQLLEAGDASSAWPWTFVGVVRLEREVDRRGRRRGAGDGDRARSTRSRISAGTSSSMIAAHLARRARRARRARGGSWCEVALGLADDADLHRDEERHVAAVADDELGRAAADVDDDDLAVVASWSRSLVAPRKVSCGLLVAGDRRARRGRSARGPPAVNSAPLRGVAHGARQHARRSRSASSSSIIRAVVGRARRRRAPSPRRPARRSRRRPGRGA